MSEMDDPAIVEALLQTAEDEDRQVRRVALQALAALGDRGAIDVVRPVIFERSGDLRLEAACALKKLEDTALPLVLLRVLEQQEDEENHWIALDALAEIYQAV
jgi:HEAT repeat protein